MYARVVYLINGVGEILSFDAETVVRFVKTPVFPQQRVVSGQDISRVKLKSRLIAEYFHESTGRRMPELGH